MYDKNKIQLIKRRQKQFPEHSPNIWLYYLKIAEFIMEYNCRESNEDTIKSVFIKLKLNKINPLTWFYILYVYYKAICRCNIIKSCKRALYSVENTSYYMELKKEGKWIN